jgi:nitrogen fixation-related uncharacterized protein
MTNSPDMVIIFFWVGARLCGVVALILLILFAIKNQQFSGMDEARYIVLKDEKKSVDKEC